MKIGTADQSTLGERRWLLALVLFLVGVPLAIGGIYLAVLGGSHTPAFSAA